jgi:hypothetical protein
VEIEVKDFFVQQLRSCPDIFQYEFKKIFLHLEIADHPLEIKGISPTNNGSFFKINIYESRIGLHYSKLENKVIIVSFLYNQYHF